MNPIHGVATNNGVRVNPADASQQDFIAAVYLERGEMLDAEVRRIIGEIDTSNQHAETVNGLIRKANIAQFGTTNYTTPTWTARGNDVILDNGYGIRVQPDGRGGSSFAILDAEGNQLIYQNQTLIPVPAGATVDALEVGIPVMSYTTFILEDGTKISLATGTPTTAFNQNDLSGGLADVVSIQISRGNQGMRIDGLNTGSPSIGAANLNGHTLDSNTNDGYVLLESEGVHSWEFNGRSVDSITRANPNNANDEITGYFARKIAFEADITNEFNGSVPFMTRKELDVLRDLNVNFSDASGRGQLTQNEWTALRNSLTNVRDNLTSSSQIQTVRLQRAMQTYTQNFDAMSNAQQRIYNLLRDIVNNVGR